MLKKKAKNDFELKVTVNTQQDSCMLSSQVVEKLWSYIFMSRKYSTSSVQSSCSQGAANLQGSKRLAEFSFGQNKIVSVKFTSNIFQREKSKNLKLAQRCLRNAI